MSEKTYDDLIDALAMAGGAVPVMRCNEFTRLITELFAPEEAALAAILPAGVNSLSNISKQVGRTVDEILPLLESMADKGLVFHQIRKEEKHYKLMAVLPGFFEFQFMKGGTTERDKKLARLFKDYFDKMWDLTGKTGVAMLKNIVPFSRVIPVEKDLAGGGQVVHPYEKVSEYIDKAEYISISTCYCRHHGELLGNPCDKPKENCMSFGPNAQFAAERGYGRLVSKDEALRTLDEAEKAGLVHMSSNTSKYIDFICNCCICHCGIVQSFNQMTVPAMGAISGFRLKIDEAACTACEDCTEICPLSALTVEGEVVRVDRKRCIGCGLCNTVCPAEALSMERIEDSPTPPWDHNALNTAIMESITNAAGGPGEEKT